MNKLTIMALASAAFLSGVSAAAQPKLTKDNINQVLKAMTLEEKAKLVVGSGWGSMSAGGDLDYGSVLVPGAAGTTQAIPRLGIPQTVLSDGPAGVRISPTRKGESRTFYATGFPVGTLLASSWDTDLVYKVTKAMGEEVRDYGIDVLLAPGMNIHRNPLCGRNFEYFSEDPVLSGDIAAAYVNGIQSNGVGVSAKHFFANNQETNRMNNDVIASERTLREIYLRNFEIMVRKSDPWTLMSSYNRVNGDFTQASHDLLTTVLRDEWGFKGIVMTDWTGQRVTPDQIKAGNDLMEPGMESESAELVEAVKKGTLAEADLDRCVRRILQFIVRTPRFNGYKYNDTPDLESHAKVVRTTAAESMVLLKNDGKVLPMAGVSKVALFGQAGYETIAGGTGSGNVNKAYVVNLSDGLKSAGLSLDPDLESYYSTYLAFAKQRRKMESASMTILLGDAAIPEVAVSKAVAKKAAKEDDIAVIVLSRNAGEGADRLESDFNLSADEKNLVSDVAASFHEAGKKVVVVLNIGGVIETASWKNAPDAILLAWQPGQEAGNSIADVLCGKVNPSGKLPMTFPISYEDHPSSKNFPSDFHGDMSFNPFGDMSLKHEVKDVDYTNYEEGIWVGYRYFDTKGEAVSYPFGYGLSYTDFEYSDPVVKYSAKTGLTASVTVRNAGKTAGKEAVEVYVSAPEGGLEKPAKELRSFGKTKLLQPGESQTLTFTVDPYYLASFNESHEAWETVAGDYKVFFAASVSDVRQTALFRVPKTKSWGVHKAFPMHHQISQLSLNK